MGYKILMVAPTSFFSDYGCHVRILEETRILQSRGHQIRIVTYHTGNDLPGVDVRRTLDVPWKKGVQIGSSRHKLYFDAMLAATTVVEGLRWQPDIVHGHLHPGALIGWPLKLLRRNRIPLIFDFQGSLTSEMVDHHFLNKDGHLYRPTLALEKWINTLADTIMTSSHNATRMLVNDFHYPAERVVTIADAVPADRFRPPATDDERAATARLKESFGIPVERKVVVYLGLLAQYQGTHALLDATRILLGRDSRSPYPPSAAPDVHMVVMGYPGVDSYRDYAESLGILDRVSFPGRIAYDRAPHYLSIGDVAVAPKMSATEGAGKIANYMAMGLPTVTFDTPVSREFLGNLGVYATFGSAESLAEKIGGLLADDGRRAMLGQALRQKAVADLSWEAAADRIEAVYGDALARTRGKRVRRLPATVAYTPAPPAADSGADVPTPTLPHQSTQAEPRKSP